MINLYLGSIGAVSSTNIGIVSIRYRYVGHTQASRYHRLLSFTIRLETNGLAKSMVYSFTNIFGWGLHGKEFTSFFFVCGCACGVGFFFFSPGLAENLLWKFSITNIRLAYAHKERPLLHVNTDAEMGPQ